MWDTLVVTYEGTSQVKRNKLSLLTLKYELLSIEEGEEQQGMFGCFQTILNELRSLGITYGNYECRNLPFDGGAKRPKQMGQSVCLQGRK